MHELAIACEIVEVAAAAASAAGARHVRIVRTRIGALAGVAAEALIFSYEAAARGTIAQGSRLVVESTPIAFHCPACGQDTERMELQFRCGHCGEPAVELRAGGEIIVESVEVI